ncbi:MAG TPA: hypothetical protein PKI76_02230 [Oscillospiraceae bacterium]|nr:hypothetical protein [Oscillospiraceae bacterium]HNW04188.1 hypothetical protein [Oscillospiraceae bacterium]
MSENENERTQVPADEAGKDTEETASRFDEETFLNGLADGLRSYGFEPTVDHMEGFPVSLHTAFGDEGGENVIALTCVFAPLEILTGGDVQTLQIHFALIDPIQTENLAEVDHFCRHCNWKTATGAFLIQTNLNVVSYRGGLLLRGETDLLDAEQQALDHFALMLHYIEFYYDSLKAVCEGKSTLAAEIEKGKIK